MGFEEFLEIKTLIKFAVLGIPLVIFIFIFAPTLKWKLLLTFGAVLGLVIALGGGTIGRDHSLARRRYR